MDNFFLTNAIPNFVLESRESTVQGLNLIGEWQIWNFLWDTLKKTKKVVRKDWIYCKKPQISHKSIHKKNPLSIIFNTFLTTTNKNAPPQQFNNFSFLLKRAVLLKIPSLIPQSFCETSQNVSITKREKKLKSRRNFPQKTLKCKQFFLPFLFQYYFLSLNFKKLLFLIYFFVEKYIGFIFFCFNSWNYNNLLLLIQLVVINPLCFRSFILLTLLNSVEKKFLKLFMILFFASFQLYRGVKRLVALIFLRCAWLALFADGGGLKLKEKRKIS